MPQFRRDDVEMFAAVDVPTGKSQRAAHGGRWEGVDLVRLVEVRFSPLGRRIRSSSLGCRENTTEESDCGPGEKSALHQAEAVGGTCERRAGRLLARIG